jgi:hypothetical protein
MRRFAYLPILLANAFAQTLPVPYAPGTDGPGPTFSGQQVSYSYPGSFPSIRNVDFRNFRFPTFDAAGKSSESFLLRKGRFQHDEPSYNSTIDFKSVHYFKRSLSSVGDSALVLLSWFVAGGSSSQGGQAKLFSTSGGSLKVVQEIDWDTHFDAVGPTESFDPSTNTLVIRSAHYIPGDAHCCVSAVDIVTFRWDGAHFIQAGIQTELSGYGRRVGKILPR